MTNLKISCHLITWGDEFLKGLDEARDLGYRACETLTEFALQYEDRVDEFKELLASKSLKLSALYGGGRFGDESRREEIIEYNTRVAKIVAKCGADRIVFGPGGPRTLGGSTREELVYAVKTIDEAARRCADLGLKACLHPHLGTEIEQRSEIDFILGETDPDFVFFCPDTAHLAKAGIDPIEIMKAYQDRIAYVHFKDVTPDDPGADDFPIVLEKGNGALPIFCELGLGNVNLTGSIALLREINYAGWVTVEIDASTRTPKESLRICRDYLSKVGLDLNNV